MLQQAVNAAQRLPDSRTQSFAWGELGHFYECRQNFERALLLTNQARWAADAQARDGLFNWDWQAGRIYLALGREEEAIAALEQAVALLQGTANVEGGLRGELISAQRDLQFDFRDAIAPLYRDLARLRLTRAERYSLETTTGMEEFDRAVETIDKLRLAEIQNHFGNDCILRAVIPGISIEELTGNHKAIIGSIIFSDRTAIIAALPGRKRHLHWIERDSRSLEAEIHDYRQELERFRELNYTPHQAQKLYDWLIRPLEKDLKQTQLKILVFVQDGFFRSIPMAALHNGQQFLVQSYATAMLPSFSAVAPQVPESDVIKILTLGLTESAVIDRQPFPALTFVEREIAQIQRQFPLTRQLLNENFTAKALFQELKQTNPSIVHIATHGQFGTTPEDTFLVAGNNQKLTLNELEEIIRFANLDGDAIRLLILTACQTAVGDDRITLGLAGIAVQAGVNNAIASLWFVRDAPTAQFAQDFYGSLATIANKALVLQTAQQNLIAQGLHPAFWAPFILIGNDL
ncbi:MAG: CHAT domain-containing protein [Chloroflexaceae bacterium]|nr:CHAT domain-containing protein [Chloroflexaceae bacterium]